ncbi:uncharacterized protein EI97DRAFT_456444 [Westerdykella ornata]|uniref:Uncharacterized protein n=1 Tax=Westerdykella ornata TaxID=318751 RepID=A0A6A6JQW9_WESOR|nr:uncharacterized protein EI97DRAFT_456444 [Westerdykella ornata]KAF2279040.1 hypothetical protein EI97DRAFT_456444 [Westerdykella ornata]
MTHEAQSRSTSRPPSPSTLPSSPATIRQGSPRRPQSSPKTQVPELPPWLTQLPSYVPKLPYCQGYFPRNLPPSNWPCLQCYTQPEWSRYRQSWIKRYREHHPEAVNLEEAEEMSGVALIPGRVGLVNVVREMGRMEGVGGGESGELRGRGRGEGDG